MHKVLYRQPVTFERKPACRRHETLPDFDIWLYLATRYSLCDCTWHECKTCWQHRKHDALLNSCHLLHQFEASKMAIVWLSPERQNRHPARCIDFTFCLHTSAIAMRVLPPRRNQFPLMQLVFACRRSARRQTACSCCRP